MVAGIGDSFVALVAEIGAYLDGILCSHRPQLHEEEAVGKLTSDEICLQSKRVTDEIWTWT